MISCISFSFLRWTVLLTDGVDSEMVGWLPFLESLSWMLELRLLSVLWLFFTRALHAFFTVSMNLEPGPESLFGVPGVTFALPAKCIELVFYNIDTIIIIIEAYLQEIQPSLVSVHPWASAKAMFEFWAPISRISLLCSRRFPHWSVWLARIL